MWLSEINIYPIKSLKGFSTPSAVVERRGLQLDRRWMLVDKNNTFLTQREFPKMATLAVRPAGAGLVIDANGAGSINVPMFDGEAEAARVRIWSSSVKARLYGTEINDWFSSVLGVECRLVGFPETSFRRVNYWYAVNKGDEVGFADGYPFLLIGQASLDDLNSRLAEPVPMNRFRPNFVVDGAPPFEEDKWKKIRIGATVFHVVKPCSRCVITTTDQESGIRTGAEPLKTLATYRTRRRSGKQKILFGQNLIADVPGAVVRIGDPVEILETK